MEKKITITNIKAFLEGNSKMILADMGIQPQHIKEQIAYRMKICSECMQKGKCEVCGCKVPGKLYVAKSCNGGIKFPDLMGRIEWEEFKKVNKIE